MKDFGKFLEMIYIYVGKNIMLETSLQRKIQDVNTEYSSSPLWLLFSSLTS